MEIGLHIADFTWGGGAAALRGTLAEHVRAAEAAGIARITVMDHFWQIPQIGPDDAPMLEAYTLLGFVAAHTERVLLHTLVSGVVHRPPAVLAKAVSTLDVLSGGRAGLGIGAGWYADEAAGLGLPFPGVAERFEELEDTVRICRQLWSGSTAPFEGARHRLGRTLDSPGPLSSPYLMIGGVGERRTLRLVARYADACNLFPDAEPARRLDVLRGHCDVVGRDFDDIERTVSLELRPGETADDLLDRLEPMRALGFTVAYVNAIGIPEPARVVDVLAEVVARGA